MTVHRIRIPETVVIPGRRLGRHIHIDDRSAGYPAELASVLRSVRHVSAGLPLDQGNVGSCTGNALCGALNTVPHWASGQPTLTETDAVAVYSDEEVLEGFGPYPPNDQGGSGTEVCQAAKNRGWIVRYENPATIAQALFALVPRPVITGVNWYTSFDTPDAQGRVSITPGATVRGGHEFLVDELQVPAGIVITQANVAGYLEQIWLGAFNSWGLGYGLGGRFYFTAATWQQLLEQGGDVTVPRTAHGWVAKPLTA